MTDLAVLKAGLDDAASSVRVTGVIANLPLAGQAFGVVLAGAFNNPVQQLAYVATWENYGLAIVDAETAKSPLIFSQLQLNGTATDVSVDNGLGLAAVATGSGGLQIVNITDPRNPRLVTTM